MLRACLLLLCLLRFAFSQAQQPFTKEFWLNESSIPVKVNDMVYAPDHYTWLATDNGLYRFNGRHFTLIRDTITQAATAVSASGGLVYTGFKDGRIGLVKNDEIVLLPIRHRAPASSITSIHPVNDLLFLTTEEEGLFVVVSGVGIQMTAEQGLADNFIYDALILEQEIALATDRGINLLSRTNGKPGVKVFTTAQGLPDNIVRVMRAVPNSSALWIGTQEGGLGRYDRSQKRFEKFFMSSLWAWGQVNDILPVSSTESWVATEDGYLLHAIISGDSLDIQPFSHEGVKLTRLIRDKSGNIWCASNKGVMMSTVMYASFIGLEQDYKLKQVTAITCDAQKNLWFTQNNELYKLSMQSKSKPEFVIKTEAAITCLTADNKGNLWVGTFGDGLFYYAHGKLYPQLHIGALADGHILSVAATADRVWIASLNGVEEVVTENPEAGRLRIVRHHNKLSGVGSDYVYQLYPDRKGRMWMATDGGGVCMFDGKSYRRWSEQSGLKSNVVYSLTEDAAGNIWAGTLQQGLLRLANGRWTQFTRKEGLQDLNVYALRGTASGQVVIVDEDGINEWYPASRQFRQFNRRLGVGIDSTLGIPNCIANDAEGNVYVPFEHGFIVFKSQKETLHITPVVSIRSVSLFNKELPDSRHRFRHDENHLSFRYDGINFSNADRLHYRYKLSNYDTSWVYTSDEVVPFVQLPPGTFTFHVQAAASEDFSNPAEAQYMFTIAKPYWQRAWFIVLVAGILLGAGYGYIKIRERNLRKLSRLQRERMVFEYEHLKSQVNPHFLFNSLNTLVSLIEDDQTAAVDYTVHLSDLYRNMLSYKDQDLIFLSEEYEIIKNYMYIQRSRFGDALHLEVDIPGHLFATRRVVPLALQLLVENAIKHNIVSLSRPLTIRIVADEDTITVSNPIQPKASKEKGAGLGIANIKKRYALLTSRTTRFGAEGNMYVVKLPLL